MYSGGGDIKLKFARIKVRANLMKLTSFSALELVF